MTMLQAYLFPIGYALLTFPMLAFVFTLPFLIVQYRKYGYVNKIRVIVLYSFLLYLLCALYLVILPLPDTRHTCSGTVSSFNQWVPFQFVRDFLRETGLQWSNPATYLKVFGERAFLQVAFNVLLLVPLGVFLRYYFRRRILRTTVTTFLVSLFFEVTQGTGLYGIYDCPYRLFDVDDLMLNTLGGLIGYAVAPWLTAFMPKSDTLDEGVDLSVTRVSYTRRFVAWLIDWAVLSPFVLFFLGRHMLLPVAGAVLFYFVVVPYLTEGRTLGKRIVRIRLHGKDGGLTLHALLVRCVSLYFLIGGPNVLYISGGMNHFPSAVMIPLLLVAGLLNLVFGIHALLCFVRRDRMLFYERWSETKHSIT